MKGLGTIGWVCMYNYSKNQRNMGPRRSWRNFKMY